MLRLVELVRGKLFWTEEIVKLMGSSGVLDSGTESGQAETAAPRRIPVNKKEGGSDTALSLDRFYLQSELRGLDIPFKMYFGDLIGGAIYLSYFRLGLKLNPVTRNLGDHFALSQNTNLAPAFINPELIFSGLKLCGSDGSGISQMEISRFRASPDRCGDCQNCKN